MVLYLSIQLRCCNKNQTEMFIKRPTHKSGYYLILSSDLEELLNLMCTQFFPLSSGSYVHTAFSIIIRKLIIKTWHFLR